jgi:hypothetical protein
VHDCSTRARPGADAADPEPLCAHRDRAIDWDNVWVFLAVARAGQFVAAAKRLKLDHATVRRRIPVVMKALERRKQRMLMSYA